MCIRDRLWVAIVAAMAIVTLYVVANIGQQWSSDQMDALRARLQGLLERADVRLESVAPSLPHEGIA